MYSLLKSIPGRIGVHRAYVHYCAELKKGKKSGVPEYESFRATYFEKMREVENERRTARGRARNRMKFHGAAVRDNSEVNSSGAVSKEDERTGTAVGDEENSLLYDRWLAEVYSRKHASANEMFGTENCPRVGRGSSESVCLSDVARAAWRDHVLDGARPVLSHELADFKTPYMMKRSTHKKLLESVARNPIEEKLVEKTLDKRGDLV